jgi:uncharacterized protein YfaS (alpha-2-macroglobulin family)
MDLIRRFRGGSVAMALLVAVVACSQVVDFRMLVSEVAGFSLTPAGDDVARLAPVTVTFAKSPTERDPASLLQILPAAPGSYAWLSTRTLLFQPDFPGLMRGATYTALVPARPEAGLPQAVVKKFTVAGKLTVQQVIPGDTDTEVPLNARILVQFSRSVAPLTTLGNQPKDTVVTFDPPVHGTGEWLNTSIYRFIPDDLRATQTYKLTIGRGLSSAVDGVLEQDFRSTFTTIGPGVDQIVPDGNWLYGGPWQESVITFNQPMAESAAAGVTVRSEAGALVPGTRTWSKDRTVLTFNPTQRMTNETKYVITVEKGLKGDRGGETAKVRTSAFTTVGAPSVKMTYPTNGQRDAGRYGVGIQFNSPMDPESLEGKLSISGFTAKDLEGRVSTNEFGVGANIALEGLTTYTVTLAPGALDRYGQVMGGYRFSFTTGELPSSVFLALPGYGGAATYSASTEPFVWFQTTNKNTVGFTLYPLTPAEAKSTMHDFNGQRLVASQRAIREWTETIAAAKDEVRLNRTSLTGGGALPKGYYLLTTDGQFGSRFAFAVVDTVIVTKLSNDELLAWALDHDTGKPISGLTIHTEGVAIATADKATDANGLVAFPAPKPLPGPSNIDRGYWVTAGAPDGERLGVVSSRWQSISPFQFGLPMAFYATEWVGHVYSDRPIYRPGETVLYKGIIRADDDALYTLPPRDGPFEFILRNARGQELQRKDVRVNAFGSFEGLFDLPTDAPTGDYFFAVQLKGSDRNGMQIAGSSFLVSAFRKPEFQVGLVTAKPSYTNGDTIDASLNASFFFGGVLEGATVDWTAVASAYVPRVPGFEGYSFTDFDFNRQAVAQAPIRGKGTTNTGANGTARITLPAVLNASEGAQTFTLSATVTDQNGQGVGTSTQFTVHPASVYAGVRADRWVATVGVDAKLLLASVDTDGKVLPNQTITVKIYDRQWITSKLSVPGGGRRYQSDARDTLLTTLNATTDDKGTATVTYRPAKSGQLRIVAEATDSQGRVARASNYLWASGFGFALWQVTNDDAIKLVADRDRYEVGDTAQVLVPAPFAGATALVTIERGKIITREVRVLPTNSERLAIPITDRAVPDVFVSAVLYRAPTPADPLPRYKVGYVELPVSTQTRQLNVKITTDRAEARPGDTVKYDIKVTDTKGKGVRSEVSVAVVDKAVLSLQDERGVDGLHAFWFERGLAVSTTSSMGNSLDRWNDVIAELPKQGKGGAGGGFQAGQVRQDFRNTAYWDAQVTTNDDGTATVSVVMPDDLTTWRMQARAISGDTMVGEGTNELVSTKPLLIRSALPRFVRVGDAADLRVLVRNGTKASANVAVTLKAQGVEVGGPASMTQTIAAGASVSYVWPAKVSTDGDVKLTFTASGGAELEDAMSVTLPSLLDVTPETMSTGGIVTKDTGYEAIYLPKFADTRGGSLSVSVRSALVGSLAGELDHFKPTPMEGAPHVASRLIATIGVARAEKAAGGNRSFSARISSDVAGLIGRQRPDGGWAWCDDPICPTDANTTAWVLLALGEARRDGAAIDSGIASRASQIVYGWVNKQNTTLDAATNDQDQKAFMLAALASSGASGVSNVANALYEQERARLSNWGRAYLVSALVDGGGKATDEAVRAQVNDRSATTIPSANGNHWENGTTSDSKGSWWTSTGTTALVALALARTQPEHQLLPQSIRWLVVARGAQGWQTTVERALSILALTSYAVRAGELGSDYGYKVLLDDREVLAGLVKKSTEPTADSKRVALSTITPGKTSILAVQRSIATANSGRLYYTLDLRYTTPAKEVEAVNRGFAVSHKYTLLGKDATPITSAKLGDTIVVTVTVLAPFDRNYVTVEDLLPAGLEAIDARLKTTDPAMKVKLDADRASATQRKAGGYMAPWFWWYYSPWQQVDTRDDRTVLKTDRLPKGVHEYTYFARATTTGDFFVAPAHAEETYFPEVFGRSDSARFRVTGP